jgi:hypothetical protein
LNPNCAICGESFRTGDRAKPLKGDRACHESCFIGDTVEVGKPAAAPLARALPVAVPKFDSKLEQLYWLYLQARLKIGEIRRVDHHCERLLLGEGAWYTPDFRVIATDDTIEMHETKGGFAREASIVRLKVAAALHPYRFFLVKNKGTATAPRWELTRVGSCED